MYSSRKISAIAALAAFSALSIWSYSVRAGTGPGGVGETNGASILRLWIKADAGVERAAGQPAENGEKIAIWRDQSGYGQDAVQTNANNRPTLSIGVINNRPAVYFDCNRGFNEYMQFSHFMHFTNFTIFDAGRLTDPNAIARMVFAVGGHTYNPKIQIRWHGSGDQYWDYVSDAKTNGFQYLKAPSVRAVHFGTHLLNGQTYSEIYNGQNQTTTVNTNYDTNTTFDTGSLPAIGLDANISLGLYPMIGYFTEIVIYQSALSLVERQVLYNHLAAKYGITLLDNSFYAGATAEKGDYDADVIGIGRAEDISHSSSESAGLRLTAAGGLANGAYLFAGHKTATNSLTSDDLLNNTPLNVVQRWQRVWYLDKTAALSATLTFDWNAGGLGDKFDSRLEYRLLYSSTESPYAFRCIARALAGAGSEVSFTMANEDLQDGYYTIGVAYRATMFLLR